MAQAFWQSFLPNRVRSFFIVPLLFAVTSAFSLFAAPTDSSDLNQWRFGIFGHGDLVQHRADFNSFPGVAKAQASFSDTGSTGFSFGALAEWQWRRQLRLGLRLSIQPFAVEFEALEATVIADSNRPVQGIFRHSLESSFLSVGIEPNLIYEPLDHFLISFGGRLAVLPGSDFSQRSVLAEPVDASVVTVFPDKSGSIAEIAPVHLALTAGIAYELAISPGGAWRLRPELRLEYGLSNFVRDTEWQASTLHAGLALIIGPAPDLRVRRDTLYQRDTTTMLVDGLSAERLRLDRREVSERSLRGTNDVLTTVLIQEIWVLELPRPRGLLSGSMSLRFLRENGREQAAMSLELEAVRSEQIFALPGVLVFDDGLSILPSHQQQLRHKNEFDFRREDWNYDEVNANLLNILGWRLNQDSSAWLDVLAQPHKGDYASETDLALARARSIRAYLKKVWAVDEERIGIDIEQQVDSNRESAAIGLRYGTTQLQAPLQIVDTIARPLNDLPTLRFFPTVLAESGVKFWRLTILIGQRELHWRDGDGEPPASIDVPLDFIEDFGALLDQALAYRLTVTDYEEQTVVIAEGDINLRPGGAPRQQAGELPLYSQTFFLPESSLQFPDSSVRHIVNSVKSARAGGAALSALFLDAMKLQQQNMRNRLGALGLADVDLVREADMAGANAGKGNRIRRPGLQLRVIYQSPTRNNKGRE